MVLSSHGVHRWHALLKAFALLNLVLLGLSATAFGSGSLSVHASERFDSSLQLLMCAGYVAGCTFRSLLPVYDIPRLVLVDSPLSSVFVGRSVATIAELCFAAQWALVLRDFGMATGSPLSQALSLGIMPLILTAEIFSWRAVLTTSQYGHIIENSLWGFSAILVVAGLLAIGPGRLAALCPAGIVWCAGGVIYIAFMFGADVPMYWSRWRADQARGRRYLTLTQGLSDASRRWSVSHHWDDWRSEVLWMSLYFSLGVWSSISIAYATAALDAHAR